MPLLEAKVCLVLIVAMVLAIRISLTSRRLKANAAAIKPSLSSSSFDAATEPPLISFISLASADLDDFFFDTVTATDVTSQDLEYDFYGNTCPRAEKIMRKKMAWIYNQHRVVAAQLLRLFFHVCFIEGRSRPMVNLLCFCIVIAAFFSNGVVAFFLDSHEGDPKTEIINNTLMVSLTLIQGADSKGAASVWYDSKAIVNNGQRRILISGSIHYPRSTPKMWPDLIERAKEGCLDVTQTYVFWNRHEHSPGKYYFEDNYDLVKFIKLVQQAGLYVHLRIGPYVCAEWNFGGFPVWLKYIPGIQFRTDNEPFKDQMQRFTTKIVNMMKAERLFESHGDPIILSQIENEYGPMEYKIGEPSKAYTYWEAQMVVGLNTGVPWVLCKQDDAPDPVVL